MQQMVELTQLATLAFPTHPHILRGIPEALAMKKVERRVAFVFITGIKFSIPLFAWSIKCSSPGSSFCGASTKSVKRAKRTLGSLLPRKLILELAQKRIQFTLIFEQGWNDNHGAVFQKESPSLKSRRGNIRGGIIWIMSQFTISTAVAKAGRAVKASARIICKEVPPAKMAYQTAIMPSNIARSAMLLR